MKEEKKLKDGWIYILKMIIKLLQYIVDSAENNH